MLTLHTRDGRKVGNAIIVDEATETVPDGSKVWNVQTDFGNWMKLTDREIDDLFFRGEQENYVRWDAHRRHARNSHRVEVPEPPVL